jgi:hypothetical protein
MRGWTKALLWAGILLACAGVGAGLAYFFPEWAIRDAPQSGPVEAQSPSPSNPEIVRWSLTVSSRTTHTYRVGGSCTGDWGMRGGIRLTESGRLRGRGLARLLLGARCDFPSAQVQVRRVVVQIVGRREGDELVLRFREVRRQPVGSQDLGGFLKTLPTLRFSIPERAGAAASKRKRIEDADGEVFFSVTRIRLRA